MDRSFDMRSHNHIKHSLCRSSTILIVLVILSYITFYLSCSTPKAVDFRIGNNRSANEVRVLCWVMTNPNNHRDKAIHVQRTWGQRCNKLIFMSSEEDSELSSVALNVKEGRENLWAKTKEAFKYVYQHHLGEAEWFLKADDDTYVIVENLRFFLKDFDSNNPMYFGCKFKSPVVRGYMSGGAGYVLSKEAVIQFVENSLPDGNKCWQDNSGDEDVQMGKCLENVGIEATDTRDAMGRYRFIPFNPEIEVVPRNQSDPYWDCMYYPEYKIDENVGCASANTFHDAVADQLYPIQYLSDSVISFHYVPPKQMYLIDYLLYHLRLHKV